MVADLSVIFHTVQAESSHSHLEAGCGKYLTMDEGEIFIKNLVDAIKADNLNEAALSRKAGLNKRAVTDLREGRVKSPKISTAVKIAKALGRDPAEMMGLAPEHKIAPKVAKYLGQYDETEQERLLDGILAVHSLRA